MIFENEAQAANRLIAERRSVRGFLPDRVPQEVLDEAFALAGRAPSNCNTQPWIVRVVSGRTADILRNALHDAARARTAPTPDMPMSGGYFDVYRERQIGAAKALFATQGIAREDIAARDAAFLRNFRFFDAPHAAFLFLHARFGIYEAVDCGIYAQTLMLALRAHGVASCAQGALGQHATIVRRVLETPDDHRLLFGIAFGYADPDHPVNTTRVDRASLGETTVFLD